MVVHASAGAWIEFAIEVTFLLCSIAAASVWIIETFESAEHEQDLDELWDDGPEPSWAIRQRYEIRELPEIPKAVA